MTYFSRSATSTIACIVLIGCSSTPRAPLEQRYTRLDWAKGSVHQAEAECRQDIQDLRRMTSMYRCMKAKGWQGR